MSEPESATGCVKLSLYVCLILIPVNKKYCQSLVDVDVDAEGGERGADELLLPVSGDVDVEGGERGVDEPLLPVLPVDKPLLPASASTDAEAGETGVDEPLLPVSGDVDAEGGERGVDEPLLPVSGDVDVEAGERGVDEPLQGLHHLAVSVLLVETLHLMQQNAPLHSQPCDCKRFNVQSTSTYQAIGVHLVETLLYLMHHNTPHHSHVTGKVSLHHIMP